MRRPVYAALGTEQTFTGLLTDLITICNGLMHAEVHSELLALTYKWMFGIQPIGELEALSSKAKKKKKKKGNLSYLLSFLFIIRE